MIARGGGCPRCAGLEVELAGGRAALDALGRPLERPPPGHDFDLERALAHWLPGRPRASAADGYRAGWRASDRHVTPQLREWQALWWQAMGETNGLRARLGVLLQTLSQQSERG